MVFGGIDPSCFIAAIFFAISGIFRSVFILFRVGRVDFNSLRKLEGNFVKSKWTQTDETVETLRVVNGVVHILAWLLTASILFRAAWLQSAKVPNKVGMHTTIAFLGGTTFIVELLVRMLEHGNNMALKWMASNFNMENWYEVEGLGPNQQDLMGWKTIEVISRSARGMLRWVDAAEFMFSALVFLLFFLSTSHPNSPLSNRWSRFGMLVAFLCIWDVAADAFRSHERKILVDLVRWISSFNRIVFFPVWLIWLGSQLTAGITQEQSVNKGMEEEDLRITDPSIEEVAAGSVDDETPETENKIV